MNPQNRARQFIKFLPFLLFLVMFNACSSSDPQPAGSHPLTAEEVGQAPPVAEKRSFSVVAPGGTRLDEYYWLRDDTRKDEKMLAYLNAENAYTDAVMKPLAGFKDQLYKEMVGRFKQDDATVPTYTRITGITVGMKRGKSTGFMPAARGAWTPLKRLCLT